MRVRYPKKVYGPYFELSHQERDLNQFENSLIHEEHMCSSAAHWKCSILQNTFKVFNICCIVGVQIVFYT